MKLVIGGAYQGKRAYASRVYRIEEKDWIDGASCLREEIFSCAGIYHFHQFIRRQMDAGENIQTLAQELVENNPDLVVVSDEVGYGIVPMDAKERDWRERCGRVCTDLAKEALEVVRVCCGIGQRIKG